MTKKITKISVENFGSSGSFYIQADNDTIAKIAEFVAKLNIEIHIPTKDPTDNG